MAISTRIETLYFKHMEKQKQVNYLNTRSLFIPNHVFKRIVRNHPVDWFPGKYQHYYYYAPLILTSRFYLLLQVIVKTRASLTAN